MMQQETSSSLSMTASNKSTSMQQTESVMISRLDALLNGAQLDDDVQRDSGNSSDFSSSGISVDDHQNKTTKGTNGLVFERGVQCCHVLDSMFDDDRVLSNLVYLEDFYRIHSNYFMFTQAEIKPWMHKTLACWMLEVCKNQSPSSYDEIFTLSMNLLDRFLSLQPIAKRHLQLLGTVCMFISAKLKCSSQYSAETLVIYTANSITIEQLLSWEQLVLQRLRWDVQSVLAVDIVPHLIARLNIASNERHLSDVRAHLSNLICTCATEFKFSVVPASMIAASCLYLTLKYVGRSSSLEYIHSILGNTMDFECLLQCVEQIEELVRIEISTNNSASNQQNSANDQQNMVSSTC